MPNEDRFTRADLEKLKEAVINNAIGIIAKTPSGFTVTAFVTTNNNPKLCAIVKSVICSNRYFHSLMVKGIVNTSKNKIWSYEYISKICFKPKLKKIQNFDIDSTINLKKKL